MAAAAVAPVGEVVAAVHSGGDCLLEVRLPSTAFISENVAQLKRETMSFMTDYMKRENMDTAEVDLMEEVVSDGEGEGGGRPAAAAAGKKGQKGKKRKQQESPKT